MARERESEGCPPGTTAVSQAIYNKCGPPNYVEARSARECINANGGNATDDIGGNDSDENPPDKKTCETEGGDMAWILCPVLNMFDSTIEWFDRRIQELLTVPNDYLAGNAGMRRAWGRMRNIAYSILIPVMLVMVIGTAIGTDLFSAYTVKRAMPRFAIAVVFIALSWDIVTFMVALTNDVGRGVMGLIQSAVAGDANISLAGLVQQSRGFGEEELLSGTIGLSALVTLGLFGAGILTMGMIFSYAFIAATVMFITFMILIFRQMLIVFLALVAPLAILAWIFPGNDKLWKLWWGAFTKLLMVFPFIAGLIAIGKSFAWVVDDSSTQSSGDFSPFMLMIMLIAYLGPYFLIPFTLKWAGGFFATVAGMANDRTRGLFDRQKQYRAKSRQETMQRAKYKTRFKESNPMSRLNPYAAGLANINKVGLRPSRMGTGLRTAMGTNTQEEIEKNMKENRDYAPWMNNDDLNRAATESRNDNELRERLAREKDDYGQRKHTDAEVDDMVIQVKRVRDQMSETAFRQMTTQQAIAGGTAYKDAGETFAAIAVAAGDDDRALERMVAQARSDSEKNGRIDIGGAGFGTSRTTAKEFQRQLRTGTGIASTDEEERKAAIKAGKSSILNGVMDSSGASKAIYGKRQSAENIAEAHAERIQNITNGIQAGTHSQEHLDEALASAMGIYDAMGQASPQNAKAFARKLMAAKIKDNVNGGEISVYDFANSDTTVNNDRFVQMRRDYSRGYASQAREQRAAAANAAAQGVPPPGAGGPPPRPGGPPGGP